MDIQKPISSSISSASFSFLTAEEIRRISVKQIVNPTLLDITNNPTSGGLYDSALGPMRAHDVCSTCQLNSYQCPGHYGHIELPSPVFHPLFLTNVFALLRGTCLYCHHFKMPKLHLVKTIARLRLLEFGLVQDAENIAQETLLRQSNYTMHDTTEDQKARKSVNDQDEQFFEDGDGELKLAKDEGLATETLPEFTERIESAVKKAIRAAKKMGNAIFSAEKGGTVYEARKRIMAEFMVEIHRRRCGQCSAINPPLRKDGHVKIMEKALTEKEEASMSSKGFKRLSAVQLALRTSKRAKQSPDDAAEPTDDNAMDVDDESEQADKDPFLPQTSPDKASGGFRVVPPAECRAHLRMLFRNEETICSLIFGRRGPFQSGNIEGKTKTVTEASFWFTANGASADNFFMEVLVVPPTRFRPASMMGDQTFENSQNELLTKVLNTTFALRDLNNELTALTSKKDFPELGPDASQAEYQVAQKAWNLRKRDVYEKLLGAMIQVQVDVNCFIDSDKNPAPTRQGQLPPPGVKQGLEKKEGLFRKHMMGKRVNFAARSVISPDVNIETNEIGVPPVFAKKLTYPEPVTHHNVQLMRQLVINGPFKYPGAVAIRSENGSETLLEKLTLEERTALANQLLTPQEHTSRFNTGTFGGLGSAPRTPVATKQVLRHLRDGDILLLNRQPTLHKPSMMAHKARVLQGEKTIRMHYANCNSYNADFDGDEMNMHFPQSQAARAECYNIANTDNQYLVPTSGNPLRGLIQDHVVAGVWMTCKNTLYTRAQYQQMLYGALRPENNYTGGGRVLTLPPAIVKPQPLWTGKQIISTVLLNLKPVNAEGLNMTSKSKVSGSFWGADHADEQNVIIRDGQLLCGILDKSQFGAAAYGLVHSVFEIYGAETAGKLLSILSRLFTNFLQTNAFSCRMDDLMLSEEGDSVRQNILKDSKGQGKKVAMNTVGLEGQDPKNLDTDRNLRIRMEEVLRDDNKLAALDSEMMGVANNLTSTVIKGCVPSNLYKKFPENNMQMMTVSGAKGSAVNVSQISCLLGQQALEGRRVPLMVSGKSLPSFKPFDTTPRSGGFISGRFLTGIRPQEYFFHCMAGREGLIDTAVKTSRSGYLQRCLIKHLEGAHVHYDYTVRNSDGSVLQFAYGEDALDTTKSKYLERFDFTALNFESFKKRYDPKQLGEVLEHEQASEHMKKALKKPHKYAPALSMFSPAIHFGSMSEGYARKVEEYIETNPDNLLGEKRKKKKRKSEIGGIAEEGLIEKMHSVKDKLGVEAFRAMTKVLYHRGLVDPGEAVGLLAAQGIGEPSTQMTLNTFHFAGHGAANVTLGIPRLREIVMTAAKKIQTPIMRLPVLDGITTDQIKTFCKDGSRLVLSQVIDEALVTEKFSGKAAENGFVRQKTYTVRLNFYPAEEYQEEYNTTTEQILNGLEVTFTKVLENEIVKEMRKLRRDHVFQAAAIGKGQVFNDRPGASGHDDDEGVTSAVASKGAKVRRDGNDADSDDDDAGSDDGDGDADEAKRKQRSSAHASYDDGEEDSDDDVQVRDTEESIEAAFRDNGSEADDGDSDDGQVNEDWAEKASKLEIDLQTYSKFITSFKFDTKNGAWAELDLQLSGQSEKILLIGIVERACRKSIIHEIPNISRVLKTPPKVGEKGIALTAEGINFRDLWEFGFGVIDLDNLYTNDIAALLNTYGVESARAAIVLEMRGIFGTYGIEVSPRHLYLIADYQTAAGGFRPFNRSGISNASSPLLKASFEQTMVFLGHSALHGDVDNLHGPSGNIVVGRPVHTGTGAPEIRMALPDITASA